MKKNLLWMFAAILTSGMTMTSCVDASDNPVGPDVPQPEPLVVNFEDGVSPFVIADEARMTGEVVADETAENGTQVLKFTRSGSSGFGFAAYQLPDMENATKVKVSFDFNIPAEVLGQSAIAIGDAAVHNAASGGFNTSSGQYGYGTNGAIFYLGAFRGKAYGGGNENYFQINGLPAAASQEVHPASDIWGKWFHVDLDVNVAEKLVSYSVKYGEEEWFAGDTVFVSENAETCTQLSVYIGYGASYLIDNISVTKVSYDANIKYADYTVSYVDTEGNPIPEDLKTTITRRGKVGSAITLLDADKANFATADGATKYIYESDNSEGATVTEAGTEIKIVFKVEEALKYKYVVGCYVDGFADVEHRLFFKMGEEFEGVNTTILLATCYGFEGAYYTVAPKQYNGYDVTITGTEAKQSGYIITTVNYAKDESIVYYAECEDMEKEGEFGVPFSMGTFNRFSQGSAAQPKIGSSMFTPVITAGTYTVGLYFRNDKNNTSKINVLYVRDANGNLTKIEALPNVIDNKGNVTEGAESVGNAAMGWIQFLNVTIPEGGSLVIKNETDTDSMSYDCIKVTKQASTEE